MHLNVIQIFGKKIKCKPSERASMFSNKQLNIACSSPQRSERYGRQELSFLLSQVKKYINIIESPNSHSETKYRKTVIWQNIARELHKSFPSVNPKSSLQLRNWWKRTKSRAKQRQCPPEHVLPLPTISSGVSKIPKSSSALTFENGRGYLDSIILEICELRRLASDEYSAEKEANEFKQFLEKHDIKSDGSTHENRESHNAKHTVFENGDGYFDEMRGNNGVADSAEHSDIDSSSLLNGQEAADCVNEIGDLNALTTCLYQNLFHFPSTSTYNDSQPEKPAESSPDKHSGNNSAVEFFCKNTNISKPVEISSHDLDLLSSNTPYYLLPSLLMKCLQNNLCGKPQFQTVSDGDPTLSTHLNFIEDSNIHMNNNSRGEVVDGKVNNISSAYFHKTNFRANSGCTCVKAGQCNTELNLLKIEHEILQLKRQEVTLKIKQVEKLIQKYSGNFVQSN